MPQDYDITEDYFDTFNGEEVESIEEQNIPMEEYWVIN